MDPVPKSIVYATEAVPWNWHANPESSTPNLAKKTKPRNAKSCRTRRVNPGETPSVRIGADAGVPSVAGVTVLVPGPNVEGKDLGFVRFAVCLGVLHILGVQGKVKVMQGLEKLLRLWRQGLSTSLSTSKLSHAGLLIQNCKGWRAER